MLDAIIQKVSGLFGARSSGLSVPILDGAFKPNNLLEEAEVLLTRPGLTDMALAPDGRLLLAAGSEVLVWQSGQAITLASHEGAITALAVLHDGRRAVALGSRLEIEGRAALNQVMGRDFRAITALSVMRDGRLLVCDGSSEVAAQDWKHDLMRHGRTGRILALDPETGHAELMQDKLAWAYGAMDHGAGVMVSESWRHRLVWAGKGDASPELPGYPARITPCEDGGFWLSLFSGRAQIVEFVLQEHAYRHEMMATIDPAHWISPAMSSGQDFYEPLQTGGVKHMGILKPWSPPRSYGLAVRCDAHGTPQMSVQSRVGGVNHGVTTTIERGNEVFALSQGAGRLLRMDLTHIRRQTGMIGAAL